LKQEPALFAWVSSLGQAGRSALRAASQRRARQPAYAAAYVGPFRRNAASFWPSVALSSGMRGC
ncbi:MAG: hypothetical protein ACUVYA_06480, partial [Planctomycetota bacterium]